MTRKIDQTVVFVTGANRGIGRAFVEAYLAAGARRVYAAGRRREELAPVVAVNPRRVVPVVLDITDDAQIRVAVEAAADVNVLVNNAGVLSPGGVVAASPESLRRDLEVNYFGTLAVTRAFAPTLARNGGGVVVNVLSIVSLASMPALGGYSVSKAAAWSATQSLRAELALAGTRIVAIFPGPIDTDMTKGLDLPKTPAITMAKDAVAGIIEGRDNIFPDPMSQQVYAGWVQDHAAVERQFAGM